MANMKFAKNGVVRCPKCGKFFGTKKLDAETLENVMKHEMCPNCIKINVDIADEKKPAKKLKIGDIISAGVRGVTKHQMIPAITNNIENAKAIKMLAARYPATFNGALRYVKKAIRVKAYAIVGKNDVIDNEKFELIQKLEPSRKGITYHQIIPALEHACDDNDFAMIVKIRKHFPEQFQGSLRYMAKKYHATLSAALETVDGVPADIKKLAIR